MITASKDGFCDKSNAEISANNLKDWGFRSCDVDFQREAAKKIDSAAFALWGGRQYVWQVDLEENENESVLKKSDWPYYALRYSDFERS